MMRVYIGRHVLGIAAIAFALVTAVWGEFNIWQQIDGVGHGPLGTVFLYLAAVIELLGGIAIQWSPTARAGAVALAGIYSVWALLWVPRIVAQPGVFDRWGNFFEQFSIVSGALMVYATLGHDESEPATPLAKFAYFGFGVCVISFTLVQAIYLSATASFVPKWIPPGQVFWAIATTIAFALAAIALLSGRSALLASRLMVAMLVGFGLLVWLPAPFVAPHQMISWAGNAQNLAITGAAWIVADFLGQHRVTSTAPAVAGVAVW